MSKNYATCWLLDTQLIGTEVWNVLLLEQHIANSHVEIDSMSFDRLRESLSANISPIAFVATRHLSHWQHETIHAVVVVGISENSIHVNVNDPALSDAPCAVPRAEFLAAWSEFGFLNGDSCREALGEDNQTSATATATRKSRDEKLFERENYKGGLDKVVTTNMAGYTGYNSVRLRFTICLFLFLCATTRNSKPETQNWN